MALNRDLLNAQHFLAFCHQVLLQLIHIPVESCLPGPRLIPVIDLQSDQNARHDQSEFDQNRHPVLAADCIGHTSQDHRFSPLWTPD